MRKREIIAFLLVVAGIAANLRLQEAIADNSSLDWDLVTLYQQ